MKFDIYHCEDEEYSETYEVCNVSHRLLNFKGDKLEVELILLPEVAGHSDGQFNVMFMDKDEELEENERKYFTKANWHEKPRLKWMFGKHWIQRNERLTWFISLIVAIVFAIIGYWRC